MKIETCQMHGQVLFYWMKRPPDGYTMSGVRRTRKQTTSRPCNAWPDMRKRMSDAAKRKAKQKWAIEKTKLDNARRLRGIFFIELEDEDFKDILKNARRKLEIPMPAASPCKIKQRWWNPPRYRESQDETCLYCRSLRVHENSIGRSSLKVSWGSHCSKRSKFPQSLQFNPMPQALKILDAKAAVEN